MKNTRITLNADLLKDANIPKKFWQLGRDTYIGDKDSLMRVEKYVMKFESAYGDGVGLLLSGPTQSCKTFLATYALKCLLKRGMQVAYFSMDELFELYIGGDSAGDNFLVKFREPHCVVIDGVGVTDVAKKGKRNALEKVITLRSDNGSPYIICTDLEDNEAIRENYGEKIAACVDSDLVEIECIASPELMKAKRNEKKLQYM